MKEWIKFPRSAGVHSRQAHCDLPDGTFEREFGREGFFGPASHIIHQYPPTSWVKWEGEMRPRAFDLNNLWKNIGSPMEAQAFMENPFFKFRVWKTSGGMDHLFSNADGDDLLFVHAGEGELFCDFGHLTFREGDYILLPRCLQWRVECRGEAIFLLFEATNDGYRLPVKGMVGPHAVFDPMVLDTPAIDEAFKDQQHQRETAVVVKRHGTRNVITFPHNPLDALGWHGDNLPVKINWRDIRPLMSHRYHLPPSAHTTFLTSRFVVCTFCPRPIETDPGALKVPFYHSNNDYDEIIFYHMGSFFSRDNIHPGMVTTHPTGFPHGPHPKAFEAGKQHARKETDEVAVMVDTRDAVTFTEGALSVEWKEYVNSWKAKS